MVGYAASAPFFINEYNEIMDPLTQGVLGASLSQSVVTRKRAAVAGLFGLLGGMAPDLDVLIFSTTDPLLFLEYHRQFTHALVFIPFGGFLCGLLLFALVGRRWGITLFHSWLYCSLGYATHGLLDGCTSYGTQLLWPFSDQRFAWNVMPIIDPLYTLPILVLVVYAAVRKSPLLARVALAWALIYPCVGLVQRDRAISAGWELARERGHQPVRLEAKPSFANLIVWKIIYETEDQYYVDAVRAAVSIRYYTGDSVQKLDLARDFPWLAPDSQQAKDIERFRWFSNGYIALDHQYSNRLIDVRYSMVPNEIAALWSIELSEHVGLSEHAMFLVTRDPTRQQREAFRQMLFGR